MSSVAILSFMFLCTIALVGCGIAWHHSRARSLLERWADQHGYRLLHSEYRIFRKGPFFWRSSREQTVYYVEVLDAAGVRHTGWVRCGGWFLGLLSDQVDVRWEM